MSIYDLSESAAFTAIGDFAAHIGKAFGDDCDPEKWYYALLEAEGGCGLDFNDEGREKHEFSSLSPDYAARLTTYYSL